MNYFYVPSIQIVWNAKRWNTRTSRRSRSDSTPLIESLSGVHAVIVDESSMISDVESLNEFYSFGSNRLLIDLLNKLGILAYYRNEDCGRH